MRRRDFFYRIGGGFVAALVARPAVAVKTAVMRTWANPGYTFGFTGFKPAGTTTPPSGQIFYTGNIVVRGKGRRS